MTDADHVLKAQTEITQMLAQVSALTIQQQELTRAIIGEEKVGHKGLVKRVALIEDEHRQNPVILAAIAEARVEGDKRAHQHIEEVEEKLEIKLDELEVQTDSRADRIEQKIDRFIWLSVGGAVAAFGGGWALGASVPLP